MTNLDKRKIIANIELMVRAGQTNELDSARTAENIFRGHMLPLIETYEIQIGNLKAKLSNGNTLNFKS